MLKIRNLLNLKNLFVPLYEILIVLDLVVLLATIFINSVIFGDLFIWGSRSAYWVFGISASSLLVLGLFIYLTHLFFKSKNIIIFILEIAIFSFYFSRVYLALYS